MIRASAKRPSFPESDESSMGAYEILYARRRICGAGWSVSHLRKRGRTGLLGTSRRFPSLAKNVVRFSPSERFVWRSFQHVTQPWPQSILFGQAGFIILHGCWPGEPRQGVGPQAARAGQFTPGTCFFIFAVTVFMRYVLAASGKPAPTMYSGSQIIDGPKPVSRR
jgi:hypothetical protein